MATFFDEEKILVKPQVKSKDAVLIAIAFPNTYSIGMASLGYQTAWNLFNQSKDIKVVRWFTDIEELCRGLLQQAPYYIGFSFSWELDYKNIFLMLEKNKIPLFAKDRKEGDPIIFAGGQVINANPEPFCENFDFFLLGDLEATANDLINKILEIRHLSRKEKLNEIGKIQGVYVPCSKGTPWRAPSKRPFTTGNLSFSSILTPNCVWPNTFLLEVVRSCPELCRFCLASYGSLPFRTPDLKESLIPIIDFGLKYTNKIGLMGPSITQHPEFEELIDYLLSYAHTSIRPYVQIASVRADTITQHLIEGLFKLGVKSITMAVESGSQRLRDIINKKVTNETIKNSIQTIYDAGFKSIKLYGMVGLPFETQDDLKQTIDFLKEIKLKNKTKKLVWGCSIFVPKAQTPFQYFGVDPNSQEKLKYLQKELHQIGVDSRAESYRWSLVQALISRGDRSINKVLEKAYRYGSSLGSFNKAIKETNMEDKFKHFVFENWDKSTKLPWDNIQSFLNKETVLEHTNKVLELVN